jgi:hypothetical protein
MSYSRRHATVGGAPDVFRHQEDRSRRWLWAVLAGAAVLFLGYEIFSAMRHRAEMRQTPPAYEMEHAPYR